MTSYRFIGLLGFAVLMALHFDFWRPRELDMYFGWVPQELGYRVIWMLLAWAYVVWFCHYLWPRPRPEGSAESTSGVAAGDSSGTGDDGASP